MKIRQAQVGNNAGASTRAFTLVETMLAVFALGTVMLPALYASFTLGFSVLKTTREDLRATQIMLEKLEAIRSSAYSQLTNTAVFSTNSTVYFDEKDKTNGTGGTAYTVTFSAVNGAALGSEIWSPYRTNVSKVTVTTSWRSGNAQRTRSMQTYVAKYGIQHYVLGQ